MNSLIGPGYVDTGVALSKLFAVHEQQNSTSTLGSDEQWRHHRFRGPGFSVEIDPDFLKNRTVVTAEPSDRSRFYPPNRKKRQQFSLAYKTIKYPHRCKRCR
jgi:hypothetical protein